MRTTRTLRRTPTLMACAFAVAAAISCKDEPGSADLAKQEAAKPAPKPSTVNVVTTPVPYGKKIPCTQLLDPAKLGAALGKEVTIEDKSQTDLDAASVCQVKLAGKPPSAKEQERMFRNNARILGTLPGDEICQITAYCAFIFEVPEVKKKCESEGQQVSTEVGDLTCTRSIQAGEEYRYVVSTLDPDTKCKFMINPGPSVVGDALPKQCAKAAVDTIGPENIKLP
ncbi:MAG: hypothetical protein HY698_02950 [Deltaproteobacteria bacterium]|nr:hypothetical protein [Deltaproteobacteria bacterium]